MYKSVLLSVPEASPSANLWTYRPWGVYYSIHKHWAMLILLAKAEAKAWRQPNGKVRAHIVRESKRLLDDDNFRGGLKPILDSLRDHRLIVDDDAEHLSLTAEQRRIGKGHFPHTLIELEEVDG